MTTETNLSLLEKHLNRLRRHKTPGQTAVGDLYSALRCVQAELIEVKKRHELEDNT